MKITYNELLNEMKNAYFNSCGETVKDFSDTAARLEAVASELFTLACKENYILRQALPQTATGDYLDFHAELRDIHRKEAQRAVGVLTFYIDEPSAADTEIPSGVICSVSGEPYIQFVTDASAVIPAGELSVTVSASAVECGWEYNVPPESVTVMVNPPVGIDGVINNEAFASGSSAESDEALRLRILDSYSIPQTGFSLETVRQGLLKDGRIRDCRGYYTDNGIDVALRLKPGVTVAEISDTVSEAFEVAVLTDKTVTVSESPERTFSLNVELKVNAAVSESAVDEARERIEQYAANAAIGENIYISKIVYLASLAEGVSYCEASSPEAVQGIVFCPDKAHLVINGLRVSSYE
ncbi:MAG: baseplate J/gp47 family protein [Eubacterium sp.]|nr:baseplate J/gp47 family protein [Eubacterium sp.]